MLSGSSRPVAVVANCDLPDQKPTSYEHKSDSLSLRICLIGNDFGFVHQVGASLQNGVGLFGRQHVGTGF